jgi:hypothetical protein
MYLVTQYSTKLFIWQLMTNSVITEICPQTLQMPCSALGYQMTVFKSVHWIMSRMFCFTLT